MSTDINSVKLEEDVEKEDKPSSFFHVVGSWEEAAPDVKKRRRNGKMGRKRYRREWRRKKRLKISLEKRISKLNGTFSEDGQKKDSSVNEVTVKSLTSKTGTSRTNSELTHKSSKTVKIYDMKLTDLPKECIDILNCISDENSIKISEERSESKSSASISQRSNTNVRELPSKSNNSTHHSSKVATVNYDTILTDYPQECIDIINCISDGNINLKMSDDRNKVDISATEIQKTESSGRSKVSDSTVKQSREKKTSSDLSRSTSTVKMRQKINKNNTSSRQRYKREYRRKKRQFYRECKTLSRRLNVGNEKDEKDNTKPKVETSSEYTMEAATDILQFI